MKKLAIYKVLDALTNLIINVSLIWTLVLFIIYLVKDIPFKWYSLIIVVVSVIINTILEMKINKIEKIIFKPKINNPSEFRKNLEEKMKDMKLPNNYKS